MWSESRILPWLLCAALAAAQGPPFGGGKAASYPAPPPRWGPPPGPPSSDPPSAVSGDPPTNIDKEHFFGELKKMYKRKMLPLELASQFGHFASAPLGPADFDAKPMVLLIGQYSVGKTSFIRSLVGRDFPGQRIGPEPTTDRFVAVMAASPESGRDRVVPGNALAMRADKPFSGLQGFGNRFLEKLQGAEVANAPILDNVTLIDTPGVLSGAKQRAGSRDYDFGSVVAWFAERCDMIVLMFDAHKLDISDELKETIDALRPHYAKVRVVLNKADVIAPQQLLRVYGALMWQLGRVMATPEVVRVHLGSFSGADTAGHERIGGVYPMPSHHGGDSFAELLIRERQELIDELRALPRNAVLRRVNDLSKRGRALKVHCYLIHYLRKQMPYLFGKDEKRAALLNNLGREFAACAHRYGLSLGDFPNVDQFRAALSEVKDIRAFPKLDKQCVYEMDRMFAQDIPKLLDKAAAWAAPRKSSSGGSSPEPSRRQHEVGGDSSSSHAEASQSSSSSSSSSWVGALPSLSWFSGRQAQQTPATPPPEQPTEAVAPAGAPAGYHAGNGPPPAASSPPHVGYGRPGDWIDPGPPPPPVARRPPVAYGRPGDWVDVGPPPPPLGRPPPPPPAYGGRPPAYGGDHWVGRPPGAGPPPPPPPQR